ncbi:hypothetical protein GCM10012275_34330 [Longimycelium tulufanense]|uniref:Lycopene cyclase domain-containing protein n=1 Tax=Longimycelium tulufanense TaxID=907463 RepID=A0A8J3FXA0_9PSEU|nr:lycopene cyclase domain-containing protein [Longimycelium tulufanense]GGM60315.1 hypothetical protein GCM10012275_34330 [Longimycelium tulufanense]
MFQVVEPREAFVGSDGFEYLWLMAGCVLITLPLEFLGAGVYRRPERLARTLLPVIGVFLAWDLIGFVRGHWGFNPQFVTGVTLPGGLPVEELVFFVVIPLCALLTYEAVSGLFDRRPQPLTGFGVGGTS